MMCIIYCELVERKIEANVYAIYFIYLLKFILYMNIVYICIVYIYIAYPHT